MRLAKAIRSSAIAAGTILLGAMSCGFNAWAEKAEIFIGDDKGIGQNGMMFDVSVGSNDITVPLNDLQPGAYLLSVRVQDAKGNWTPTVSRALYVYNRDGLSGAEYFFDVDPGVGKGVSIPGIKEGTFNFSISTGNLAVGPHTLTVRTLGSTGEWNGAISRLFLVIGTTSNNVEIEWFYDQDPGLGKGNKISSESGENLIMLPTADLTPGAHLLSIRAKDTKGHWTPTVTYTLYVTEPAEDVVGGEYFVDNDPGEGNATEFGLDESGTNSFVVSTANLELGMHSLVLRGKTADGKWIPLHIAPFEVIESSGIENIVWKMTFDVRREESTIFLTGNDIPSGSRVEVVAISGIRIHNGIWADGNMPYSINIDESERNVILSITSPDGVRTVKRIN